MRWGRCRSGNASAGCAIIYPTNWCHGVLNHCSLSPLGAPSEMLRKMLVLTEACKETLAKVRANTFKQLNSVYMHVFAFECSRDLIGICASV